MTTLGPGRRRAIAVLNGLLLVALASGCTLATRFRASAEGDPGPTYVLTVSTYRVCTEAPYNTTTISWTVYQVPGCTWEDSGGLEGCGIFGCPERPPRCLRANLTCDPRIVSLANNPVDGTFTLDSRTIEVEETTTCTFSLGGVPRETITIEVIDEDAPPDPLVVAIPRSCDRTGDVAGQGLGLEEILSDCVDVGQICNRNDVTVEVFRGSRVEGETESYRLEPGECFEAVGSSRDFSVVEVDARERYCGDTGRPPPPLFMGVETPRCGRISPDGTTCGICGNYIIDRPAEQCEVDSNCTGGLACGERGTENACLCGAFELTTPLPDSAGQPGLQPGVGPVPLTGLSCDASDACRTDADCATGMICAPAGSPAGCQCVVTTATSGQLPACGDGALQTGEECEADTDCQQGYFCGDPGTNAPCACVPIQGQPQPQPQSSGGACEGAAKVETYPVYDCTYANGTFTYYEGIRCWDANGAFLHAGHVSGPYTSADWQPFCPGVGGSDGGDGGGDGGQSPPSCQQAPNDPNCVP